MRWSILIASSVIRLQAFFSQQCQGFKEARQNLELHLKLSRESLQTRNSNGYVTDPVGDRRIRGCSLRLMGEILKAY